MGWVVSRGAKRRARAESSVAKNKPAVGEPAAGGGAVAVVTLPRVVAAGGAAACGPSDAAALPGRLWVRSSCTLASPLTRRRGPAVRCAKATLPLKLVSARRMSMLSASPK